MFSHSTDLTALFIDGANLHATARALDIEIDYSNLKKIVAGKGTLLRAFYYTAIYEEQDYSPLRPLVDWLDYNGFTVVTKRAKEYIDDQGRRKVKGNMDIEIAVDMLSLTDHVTHMALFSGDGDFRRLVEAVQRKGVRVTVVSSTVTKPSMIADELRRQADNFIELDDLRDALDRKTSRRDDDYAAEDEEGL